MTVMGMIGRQARRRLGRTMALLAGILVATTGFTVLMASVATSRLEVREHVDANFRAAYDILVRPHGARSSIEDDRGLVRPNHLSGQFGGISLAQWETIRRVEGVEIAAPIAMLGYVLAWRHEELDVTHLVDRSLERQVLRLTPTWIADRGLTRAPDNPIYVYVTKRPLEYPEVGADGEPRYRDGKAALHECQGPREWMADGSSPAICGTQDGTYEATSDATRTPFSSAQLLPDGTFMTGIEHHDRLRIPVIWVDVVGAAAVDPDQEARLVGLDRAVSAGCYLAPGETVRPAEELIKRVPVLAATNVFHDRTFAVTAQRLGAATAAGVAGIESPKLLQALTASEATGVGEPLRQQSTPDAPFATVGTGSDLLLNTFLQARLPEYTTGADGALTPLARPADPLPWTRMRRNGGENLPPIYAFDSAFRVQDAVDTGIREFLKADVVGEIDPRRLRGFSADSALPLETYVSPELSGADEESRKLLGGQPLRPNSNTTGYVAQPPLVFTTLEAAGVLLQSSPQAGSPLSAVRVRVSNVEKLDGLTRERIRRVAEEIALGTGLDVDITIGSSPAPQTVALPAGKFGRPALRLAEPWSVKGVAVAIAEAIDRKSAVLFALIIAVCVLFLGNALMAGVRSRRRELAVLACVGWPRRRIAQLIIAEVGALGLLAGVASALLSVPIAAAAGVNLDPWHVLLAVPVAAGLSLLAAAVPAWHAARSVPAEAMGAYGLTTHRRRWGRPRTVIGMALRNGLRLRGRSAVAILAMAFGVAALTLVTALEWAFHGQVTGTLLGDAVSVRVRGVDTVAVLTTLLLAVAAVGDVIYLNVRERSGELAALRACGWTEFAIGRLVAYEGVFLGVIGAALGAAAGLYGVQRFVGGEAPPRLIVATAVAAGAGVVLTALASVLSAIAARTQPMGAALAEES